MKIINPYTEILTPLDGQGILQHIELCGRVCYKSEDKITDTSAAKFVAGIIKRGHEAVLEHFDITVKFVCDRGVSHEIVRHRMASYCQESTRYCNYSKDVFGSEITVIRPSFLTEGTPGWQYYEADVPAGEEYTSYVLGEGSINFEDLGAKVPYEMSRDPAKNGGQDTLYTRQRKVFAPKGISYEKTSQTTLSPTDAELSNGANWALVHSGEATESQRSYINHKVIPIARIKSRG